MFAALAYLQLAAAATTRQSTDSIVIDSVTIVTDSEVTSRQVTDSVVTPRTLHEATALNGAPRALHKAAPNSICETSPSDWRDAENFTCGDFTNHDWCQDFGDIEGKGSLTAKDACCVCGGGQVTMGVTVRMFAGESSCSDGGESCVHVDNHSACESIAHLNSPLFLDGNVTDDEGEGPPEGCYYDRSRRAVGFRSRDNSTTPPCGLDFPCLCTCDSTTETGAPTVAPENDDKTPDDAEPFCYTAPPQWRDGLGRSCRAYEPTRVTYDFLTPTLCELDGELYPGTDGKTASEACCACQNGGGEQVNVTIVYVFAGQCEHHEFHEGGGACMNVEEPSACESIAHGVLFDDGYGQGTFNRTDAEHAAIPPGCFYFRRANVIVFNDHADATGACSEGLPCLCECPHSDPDWVDDLSSPPSREGTSGVALAVIAALILGTGGAFIMFKMCRKPRNSNDGGVNAAGDAFEPDAPPSSTARGGETLANNDALGGKTKAYEMGDIMVSVD